MIDRWAEERKVTGLIPGTAVFYLNFSSAGKGLILAWPVRQKLTSHADILRGSSRVPAPLTLVKQERVTTPKNVCGGS